MMEMANLLLSIAITMLACWVAKIAIDTVEMSSASGAFIVIAVVVCAIGLMLACTHEVLITLRAGLQARRQRKTKKAPNKQKEKSSPQVTAKKEPKP